jgi:hypothetical protein
MDGEDDRDTLESERYVGGDTSQEQPSPAAPLPPMQDTSPLWVWLFILVAFGALVWGVASQYSGYFEENAASRPFLQVTNREISLFLWQNPEFMRANARSKSGYLPGFEYIGKISMTPGMADTYVAAPPEVLFRYHTWSRLLRDEYISRPIAVREFIEFLEYDEAWQPEHWPSAPQGYAALIKGLDPVSKDDLQKQPDSLLPLSVRIAFQGWKNYMYEGELINAVRPTYKGAAEFLKKHPNYARNLWRNIVDTRSQQYLKDVNLATDESSEVIPDEQLTSFFRLAYFNWQMSNQGK